MNYRHAFHAGNHADVLKHLVLARVLDHLRLKDKPFRALDAFAGLGVYDLEADEAARTGEWRDGWGRMAAPFAPEVEALLAPYRAAVAAVRARHGDTAYPGSPAVIREALRPGDKGVFVELHPADAATLQGRYARDARTKVMNLDGWTAINAQIPPPERRGLVLIDPPTRCPERSSASAPISPARWRSGRPGCSWPGTRSRTPRSWTGWSATSAPPCPARPCASTCLSTGRAIRRGSPAAA